MRTTFAATDAHTLKWTQNTFFSAVALWFGAMVGYLASASSKVKCSSGMFAFLHRMLCTVRQQNSSLYPVQNYWLKFWKLRRRKFNCQLMSQLWQRDLFFSFLNKSKGYVSFCWTWSSETSYFLTDSFVLVLLCVDSRTWTNCPLSRHLFNNRRNNYFSGLWTFSDSRNKIILQKSSRTSFQIFATCCLFSLRRFPWSRCICTFMKTR